MKCCISSTYTTGHPSYLSDYFRGHPSRFWRFLVGDIKGQVKVVSFVRGLLGIAVLTTESNRDANKKIRSAHRLLGDIKVPMNMLRVPHSSLSLHSKYCHAKKSYLKLEKHVSKGESIPNSVFIKVWTHTCAAGEGTLSIAGKLFFKPLILMDGYCKLEGRPHQVAGAWQYISIVKNGLKIGKLSGQLLSGTEKVEKKAISLFFSVSSTGLHILKLCKIEVPPYVGIVITLAKSIFEIYKTYDRTRLTPLS